MTRLASYPMTALSVLLYGLAWVFIGPALVLMYGAEVLDETAEKWRRK